MGPRTSSTKGPLSCLRRLARFTTIPFGEAITSLFCLRKALLNNGGLFIVGILFFSLSLSHTDVFRILVLCCLRGEAKGNFMQIVRAFFREVFFFLLFLSCMSGGKVVIFGFVIFEVLYVFRSTICLSKS